MIKYSSVGSAVAFLGQIIPFERRHPSEKRAKFCILNGTLPLFFGSWCMERVIKKNLARYYLQTGIVFCARTNNEVPVKNSPWYWGRDHSSAFVYWISVTTRTYMDIDVASARMTKREGGSSDYDKCARKSHTVALRVAASPGPRGLYYIQVPPPPVKKLRHTKVVVSRQ